MWFLWFLRVLLYRAGAGKVPAPALWLRVAVRWSQASAPAGFGIEFSEKALEEAAVALLVVQDLDNHVLGDPIHAFAGLDDLVVVRNCATLRRDHALDDVDNIRLLRGRLERL